MQGPQKLFVVSGNMLRTEESCITPTLESHNQILIAIDETLDRCKYQANSAISDGANIGYSFVNEGSLENSHVFVDPKFAARISEAERNDFILTVKLVNFGEMDDSVFDELFSVLEMALNTTTLEKLLLSVPALEEFQLRTSYTDQELHDAFQKILPLWKKMEALRAEGKVKRIGVCDFSKRQLDLFLPLVELKPHINQINYTIQNSGDDRFEELIEYCQSKHIELLSHGDQSDFLTDKMLRALMRKHGILKEPALSSASVVELDKLMAETQCSKPQQEMFKLAVDYPTLSKTLKPSWMAQYSSTVRCRGVVSSKCIIFAASE